MTPRIRWALIVTPPLAVLAYWAAAVVYFAKTRAEPLTFPAASDGLFYLAFFGLPIAYVAEVVIYLLGFRSVQRRGPLAVIGTALFGSLPVASLIGLGLGDGGWRDPFALAIGAFSGLVAGTAFWLIGLRPSSRAPSAT